MKQTRQNPWIVYCLLKEDGTPFYVGVTRNPARRMKEHRTVLGYKPLWRELERGASDRGAAEHRWIESFRADGFSLTNKTKGGNGGQGLGDEARALVSAFQQGRPKSAQHRARIKAALVGNTPDWGEEGLERVKASRFQPGHKRYDDYTPEQKARLHRDGIAPEDAQRGRENRWAALSADERREEMAKVRSMVRPESTRANALKASQAASASPTASKKISESRKLWWANLTPEYRRDYLARRAAAISAAKRLKKAAG